MLYSLFSSPIMFTLLNFKMHIVILLCNPHLVFKIVYFLHDSDSIWIACCKILLFLVKSLRTSESYCICFLDRNLLLSNSIELTQYYTFFIVSNEEHLSNKEVKREQSMSIKVALQLVFEKAKKVSWWVNNIIILFISFLGPKKL